MKVLARVHPRRTRTVDVEQQEYSAKYSLSVPGPNGSSATVAVTHHYSTQHTLEWEDVRFGSGKGGLPALPAGRCNLVKYPNVVKAGEGELDAAPLKGKQFKQLELLIFTLALDEPRFMSETDGSGAVATLLLLLANNDAAVGLTVRIFQARPELLPLVHIDCPHLLRDFHGEHALHVLAVNMREMELCRLLELAARRLSRKQLEGLFLAQADGAFFRDAPMNFYGGTILNYCVAFGLHRAVAAMMLLARTEGKMTTPFSLVDPNDVEHVACTYTGFAPLHVAVANGLTRMYDFLCELPGLDEVKHLRTNRHIMTRAVEWGPVGQLTPLQLATFLGDERTFQHIMKRRSTVVWAWGPVTQYQVALHGIDSIGDSDNDVMNLVARASAKKETKEMLGDEMMLGFIHDLFMAKWERFGWKVWMFSMAVDLLMILAIVALAFLAKTMPRNGYNTWQLTYVMLYGPYVCVLSMVPIVVKDAYLMYKYWISAQRSMRLLWTWMGMHKIVTKWVCLTAVLSACLYIVLSKSDPIQNSRDLQDWLSPIWVLLALPLLLLIQTFCQNLLKPSEGLSVFYIIVLRILQTDIAMFLVIFILFLVNYGIAMWLTAPPFTLATSQVDGSWGIAQMIQELTFLGLAGSELPVDPAGDIYEAMYTFERPRGKFTPTATAPLGPWKLINLAAFLVFYFVYLIMSLILLLNLLIAMMGTSYENASKRSTIDYRVIFSREILKYEVLAQVGGKYFAWKYDKTSAAPSFLGLFNLHAGAVQKGLGEDDGAYHVQFQNILENSEGGGARGFKPRFTGDAALDKKEEALKVTPQQVGSPERAALPGLKLNKETFVGRRAAPVLGAVRATSESAKESGDDGTQPQGSNLLNKLMKMEELKEEEEDTHFMNSEVRDDEDEQMNLRR